MKIAPRNNIFVGLLHVICWSFVTGSTGEGGGSRACARPRALLPLVYFVQCRKVEIVGKKENIEPFSRTREFFRC